MAGSVFGVDKIIMGVDPGTRITGYGIITSRPQRRFSALDFGCIRPPVNLPLTERYRILYEALQALLTQYQPHAVVLEKQFILKENPKSGLTLGMACAMAMLAASLRKIPVFAYAPTRVKRAIVGTGRASKEQMQQMARQLLGLSALPEPPDAADALGLALCHANVWQGGGHAEFQI